MKPNASLVTLAAALLLPAVTIAGDSASIKAPLHGTGDVDASGFAVPTLRPKKSELIIKAANLDASHAFDIEVAGIVEGTATTDRKGRLTARFSTSSKEDRALLDFDPRGQTLRILDGATSVMEGVISGTGEDNGAVVDERATLVAENAPAKARGTARYTATAKGRRTFRIDLSNAGDGPFQVLVDGIVRGDVTLRGKSGQAVFDAAPNRAGVLMLDFDPRGAIVDIVNVATVVLSGKMEAKAKGVNVASPSVTGVLIPSSGADADGTATARIRIDQRARKHFSVEVEAVPAGAYDLLVDSVAVGTIQVASTTGGRTEGEIEFTNGDDDSTELPLTFDPVGKLLTIAQSGTKFFEGTFDPNISGNGTPAPEAASLLDENLASTGLVPAAHADARYEVDAQGKHKFSVEIEDVPAGSYALSVAGVPRGTIAAKLGSNGVKGEIEFQSENEPGHRLLDFDPRGQTIEITSADGVLFSHLLGSGSATTTPGTATPFDTVVALTSSGADADATAKAEYKRIETGSLSFEVELEDLALGNYDLLVGGTVRGTITVTATSHGTRGKIRFEDAALNFEVAGQDIVIQQGATTFFTRTFPTP